MIDFLALQSQYVFLSYEFFGNTVSQYLFSGAVFLVVFTGLKLFKIGILLRLRQLAKRTKNDFDDLLIEILYSIGNPLYLLLSAGIAFQFIQEPVAIKTLGYWIAFGVIVYSVVRALSSVVDYFFENVVKKRLAEGDRLDPSIVRLLGKALKGIIWVMAILLVAQNLGFNITALVAGLGIGGVAIAFALQGVLSDVFASFSIYFDKPFQTGDFIIMGEDMGTVKHIGIKTTRIEALAGEELIVSNKELTEARIHNYRGFAKRRMTFGFGVTYETPSEKIKAIPQMVRDIIENIEKAEINRIHFTDFGDSSLNFEAVYYITSGDFTVHKDIQQEVNFALKERFEQEGIEFAYPTQTLYVHKNTSS